MSAIVLDRSLVLEAVRVTESAAIAAWSLAGRGDEMAADQAAVDRIAGLPVVLDRPRLLRIARI